MSTTISISAKYSDKLSLKKILLICGILSSLLYAAMNIFVAMQWKEYDSASQTVSELSAVDAPTRALWVFLGIVYTLLTAAFGWGLLKSASENRRLRTAGGLLVAYGITGLFWPLFPMHLRKVLAAGGGTLSDTLHIAFTMLTVLLMIAAMGYGAASLGKGFRIYSIMTIIALAVFGTLTSLDAPRVSANLPTPMAGVWERINIGVFLLWIIVLAIILVREENSRHSILININN